MHNLQLYILHSIWTPIHLHLTMPLIIQHIHTDILSLTNSIFRSPFLWDMTLHQWAIRSQHLSESCALKRLGSDYPQMHHIPERETWATFQRKPLNSQDPPKCTAHSLTDTIVCPQVNIFILFHNKCILIHWFNAPQSHLTTCIPTPSDIFANILATVFQWT